ncbi:MAG: hypothetical protein QM764_21895 [Chitinophagaceae bacterium]
MKRIIAFLVLFSLSAVLHAQDNNYDPFHDSTFIFDSLNICAILLVIYLVTSFIIQILRHSFEARLKNRIIDKSVPEEIVSQLLQPESKKEKRNYILQWFCILTAIGIGFTAMALTRPFGLHSLAILAFSIAAGFGGYYFLTRNKVK